MADVRIIDLTAGTMGDSHSFESDDGIASYKISAISIKNYCQTGLTPQSIGIPAGVTTTELGYLDGVTSAIQGQIDGKSSTSIIIATDSGLTGGGSLSANRTISLDVSSLANKAIPSGSDQVLIYDPVSLSHRRTTVSGITSGFSSGGGVTVHSALTGLNADDHPQYSLANGTRWTANQTANRVAVSTASGHLSASNISATELGYLSGVTSLIQSQLNNKTDSGHTHSIANINNLQTDLNTRTVNSRVVATASGLTGGGDLSADRTIGLNILGLTAKATPSILDEVLIYDVATSSHRRTTVSGITGYSGGGGGGVTSHNALTGLNADDHPQYSLANGTRWAANQTANRVAISTASGHLSVSSITTTQLSYLSDVTSVIQAQLDTKTASGHTHPYPVELIVAASDESTALITGTAKTTFRIPGAFTLTSVRASVTTAPVGSPLVVDINLNASTILSTKLSIDASEKTSTTAATPAVITTTSMPDDGEITIDVDQIGSSTAGAGLKVYLIGTK